jgi:hypothetical protein
MKNWNKILVTGLAVLWVGSRTASAVVILDARGGDVVNDLRQLSLAIHNYADTHGNELPGNITDPAGTPLLSWRVALLPFLGEQSLFDEFDLTQPWNTEPNLELLNRMPAVLRGPFDGTDATYTHYARGSGPRTLMDGTDVRFADITDGTSNTLLIGEFSGNTIPWTAPLDLSIEECPLLPSLGDPSFFSSQIANEVPFAFADGSVRFLDLDINCETLHGLFIRNDNRVLSFESHDYLVVSSVPDSGSNALQLGIAAVALLVSRSTISRKRAFIAEPNR